MSSFLCHCHTNGIHLERCVDGVFSSAADGRTSTTRPEAGIAAAAATKTFVIGKWILKKYGEVIKLFLAALNIPK